jgi:large subunit ribosomal protein L17
MRHKIDHRKLGRTTEHRIAMLRNQAISLVRHDRITTTLPKAKELRRFVERLITLAKKDTLHARRLAARHVHDPEMLQKLFGTLGPLYTGRPGGYTRVLKLGFRKGDCAQEAIIELVGREPKFEEPAKGKKAAKKVAPAEKTEKKEPTWKKGLTPWHKGPAKVAAPHESPAEVAPEPEVPVQEPPAAEPPAAPPEENPGSETR